MIDLHSHFLYGVDDGPATLEQSLDLLKQAEQVGVTKILATPHVTDHTTEQAGDAIQQIFSEIKQQLTEHRLHLEIFLAGEVYYSPDLVRWTLVRRVQSGWPLIGQGQKYMLFDLPLQILPPDVSETIFQLMRQKIVPVMAHPERNSAVQKRPHLLAEWIRLGCVMQLDAGSLTGEFGVNCRRISRQLIRSGYIHLVASDAHDCRERNFHHLAGAYTQVEKKFGPERAHLLFHDNPLRILNGEMVINPTPVDSGSEVNFIKKISGMIRPE